MAEREHFTNGRCFTFGTGLALMGISFGAQVGGWRHWITIGAGYGVGIVLMLIATVLIAKSYFSHQSEYQTAPPTPPSREIGTPKPEAATINPSPGQLRKRVIALAGELCGLLMSHYQEMESPYVSDGFAGLKDIPDDPKIAEDFAAEYSKSIQDIRRLLGDRSLLAERVESEFSSIGDVLATNVRNAEDVRSIVRALDTAKIAIDEKCLTGVPFSFADSQRKPFIGTPKPRTPDIPNKDSSLFTPLQLKALRLAQQLRKLAGKGIVGSPESDFNRMRLTYEKTFAPEVKELMFEFAETGYGEDSTLRRFSEFADNGNDILNVARALIRLAFIENGIDIDLRY